MINWVGSQDDVICASQATPAYNTVWGITVLVISLADIPTCCICLLSPNPPCSLQNWFYLFLESLGGIAPMILSECSRALLFGIDTGDHCN